MDTEQTPAMLPAPSVTPMTLLDKAIEKGISPDQLGKLLDLAEQWRKARAIEAFHAAMTDAQAEVPAVVKDKQNTFTKSMYAALESVVEAVLPVWTKHGFSLSFSKGKSDQPGMIRHLMTVRHRDGHFEVVEGDYPPDGEGAKGGRAGMNALQGIVSSGSYAQRDMLRLYWSIPIVGADRDGNGQSDDAQPCSKELLDELDALLTEYGKAKGSPVDLAKFLKWLGAESIESITKGQWRKACDDMERKIKQKRGAK